MGRFSERPFGAVDGVICSDVMEHVPEGQVDSVLAEIFGYATKFVALSISFKPSKKRLDDGREVHCTLRPPEWWDEKLRAARKPGQRLVVRYGKDNLTSEIREMALT
mgnify:CR=1 FL=1